MLLYLAINRYSTVPNVLQRLSFCRPPVNLNHLRNLLIPLCSAYLLTCFMDIDTSWPCLQIRNHMTLDLGEWNLLHYTLLFSDVNIHRKGMWMQTSYSGSARRNAAWEDYSSEIVQGFVNVGSRLTSDEEIREIECRMCIQSIGSLYGCENWSLALREESRLMIFVNTILKQILVS